MEPCFDCPRKCGADRATKLGFCQAPDAFLVARIDLHMWEEPPISGTSGSGTIFFGGCNLGCVFCQNRAIRDGKVGRVISGEALVEEAVALVARGAHNINLVTPSHYTRRLIPVLRALRQRVKVPIVWNSSGYESVESLRLLDGLVDVYLPDFKYSSPELAAYSRAPDYAEVATAAIGEMFRQRGPIIFDQNGLVKSGLSVRHLVLPGGRHDSLAVLHRLAEILPPDAIRLSLMSQYTPEFVDKQAYPALGRRLTSVEYNSVLKQALSLSFDGYFQDRSSATAAFTPDFGE